MAGNTRVVFPAFLWFGLRQMLKMVNRRNFMLEKYVVKHKMLNFASVFHGIRFKVRRLFVETTSNFFLYACLMD